MANWPCAIATRSTGRFTSSFTWSRTVPIGIFDAPTTVQLASSGRSTTVMTRMFFPLSSRASIFTSSKPPERYTRGDRPLDITRTGPLPDDQSGGRNDEGGGNAGGAHHLDAVDGAGCAGVAGASCALSGDAAHTSSGHTTRKMNRRIRDRQTAAPPKGRRRGCVKPGCPSPSGRGRPACRPRGPRPPRSRRRDRVHQAGSSR